MASTITSFFTFVPGTKAKASQVNTNFLNYRGDILPINTDTTTASNFTHKLGTSDHRWAISHIEGINLGQTTSSWQMKDATTTVGELSFNLAHSSGSSKFRLSNSYDQTIEITQQATFKINGWLAAYVNWDGPKPFTRNGTINTLRYCILDSGPVGSITAFTFFLNGVSVASFNLTGAGANVIINGSLTLTAMSVTSTDYMTLDITGHNNAHDAELKFF